MYTNITTNRYYDQLKSIITLNTRHLKHLHRKTQPMADFFDDDFEHGSSDEESTIDSDDECVFAKKNKPCEHIVIINGACEFCGVEINSNCSFVNDDIVSMNGPKNKKIISNINLMNAADDLPMPIEAKAVLLKYIQRFPVQAKGNNSTTFKMLCVYGYKTLLSPGIIECSPNRFFIICGIAKSSVKKVMLYIKQMRNGSVLQCVTNSYIHPMVYIKEFLYTKWLSIAKNTIVENEHEEPWYRDLDIVREKCIIPLRYDIPPGHYDIFMFMLLILSPPKVKADMMNSDILEEVMTLIRSGDDALMAARLEKKEAELKDPTLNMNFDHEYMIDKPQRLAACVLYNVLLFSIDKLDTMDEYGHLLKREAGVADPRMYSIQDISEYFKISVSVLDTLVTKNGVRVLHNKKKKKIVTV